jgi:hypothetical protein
MPSHATARSSTSSSCCVARLRRSLQNTVWFNSIYANHLQTQALQAGSTTRVTPNARCSTQPLPSTTRASLSWPARASLPTRATTTAPSPVCSKRLSNTSNAASSRTALPAPAAATAAHLTDHVFPCQPVRQWVLSVPKPLRKAGSEWVYRCAKQTQCAGLRCQNLEPNWCSCAWVSYPLTWWP